MKSAREYFEEAEKLEEQARAIHDPMEQRRLYTAAKYWRQLGEAAEVKESRARQGKQGASD